MCDAMSLSSALSSVGGGIASSIEERSQGDFRAQSLKSMAVLMGAEASDETTELSRSFREQASANLAAMAITGLDPASFASVTKGNEEDLQRNAKKIQTNADQRKRAALSEADMAQFEGKLRGGLALFNGIAGAADTLMSAETSYQDNRTLDQSRGDYLRKSMGSSFFQTKKG